MISALQSVIFGSSTEKSSKKPDSKMQKMFSTRTLRFVESLQQFSERRDKRPLASRENEDNAVNFNEFFKGDQKEAVITSSSDGSDN